MRHHHIAYLAAAAALAGCWDDDRSIQWDRDRVVLGPVPLKKQVASLNTKLKALTKDEKLVKTAAVAAVEYIGACFLDTNGNIQNLQVNDFGTTATGFLFGTPGGGASATPRSALDVDVSGSPLAYLQKVTPACVTGVTASAASAHSSISRLHVWAERTR